MRALLLSFTLAISCNSQPSETRQMALYGDLLHTILNKDSVDYSIQALTVYMNDAGLIGKDTNEYYAYKAAFKAAAQNGEFPPIQHAPGFKIVQFWLGYKGNNIIVLISAPPDISPEQALEHARIYYKDIPSKRVNLYLTFYKGRSPKPIPYPQYEEGKLSGAVKHIRTMHPDIIVENLTGNGMKLTEEI